MMIFVTSFLAAHAQSIRNELAGYCPATTEKNPGYDTWSEVPMSSWYWGDDWADFLANGIDPFTNTVGDVYPAGFRSYTLGWYSQPPICMYVPGSRNRKVEILMESPLENANLCIRDASYNGVGNNEVGNVDNCGSGKIYACFTAASTGENDNQDFGFYVSCESGCEEMDVEVWMRIRVSPYVWTAGKTSTQDDLEHWCEAERGTHIDDDDLNTPLYYTYPSDLIPDEPSEYPFHIRYIFGQNAGGFERPSVLTTVLLTVLGVAFMFA